MNKLIVVTGGTKGIGRAIIEKFAAEGFDVVTCARTEVDLEALKQVVESQYKTNVYTYVADMKVVAAVKAFCAFVRNLNRPIDVLVNNAGYFIPGELRTEADDTLSNMIEANLYSAYHTTRGLLELMIQRKEGHIFNMCSIASFQAYKNGGAYAISKFALLGFSKCLREELKDSDIRVTAIMPGATFTPSWDGIGLPEERFMPASDIADTVFGAWQLSKRSVIEELIIRPQLGDL
jgi:short-subunit dehydrogenase